MPLTDTIPTDTLHLSNLLKNTTPHRAVAMPDATAAGDSIIPLDSLAATDTIAGPDTLHMDSLSLAIFHHNQAVDDSLRLDSINRARPNGINSPVNFSAQDSMVYDATTKDAYLYGNSNVD